MPNHKLSLEEAEQNYYVVAIHSILEAYSLAFILNKDLGLNFFRHEFDIIYDFAPNPPKTSKNKKNKKSIYIYIYIYIIL